MNGFLENEELQKCSRLKKYNKDDIIYTIKNLKDAGYLNAAVLIHSDGNKARIKGLEYEGHLFLDNIRDDTIWKEALNMAGKISGSVSVKMLAETASAYFKSKLRF